MRIIMSLLVSCLCLISVSASGDDLGSLDRSVNRPGKDYVDFPIPSVQECQAECGRQGSRCQSWAYSNPGVYGSGAHCWLKSEVPAPAPDANFISGTKPGFFERATNRPGSDFMDFDVSSAQECLDQCQGQERCRAWTYAVPNVTGPSPHCWLKDGVPAPFFDERFRSGVK